MSIELPPNQNEQNLDINESAYEAMDKLENLLNSSETIKKLPRYKEWESILDGDVDEEKFLNTINEINTILKLRSSSQINIKIYTENKSTEEIAELEKVISENRDQIYMELKIAVSSPGEFLGNGSVGEVYNIKNIKDVCIKRIHSDKMYNELDYNGNRVQNRIEQEGKFLEKLEKLKVAGVRTPSPLFYIKTNEFIGISMENLDAANFARVIEKKDSMPDSFDFNDYFDRLEQYFIAMHKEGVLHKDVAIRNFMIDNETGHPRLIDFGRSKKRDDYFASEQSFEEDAKKEMKMFKIAKKDAEEKLKNLNNK